MIEHNAGHATTLAAIAQVAMSCSDYSEDEAGQVKWAAICADMRNAPMEVRVAVRQQDQPTATAGLAKLVKTCDQCHHSFRD